MHKNFSSDRKVLEDAIHEVTKIYPPEGQLWVFLAGHVDGSYWSNPMQMTGQVECKWVGKFVQLPNCTGDL